MKIEASQYGKSYRVFRTNEIKCYLLNNEIRHESVGNILIVYLDSDNDFLKMGIEIGKIMSIKSQTATRIK